jgi:hypothetical protein
MAVYSKLFPKEVVEYIHANCKGNTRAEMAEMLNAKFGTKYTTEQIKAYYGNHHILTGRATERYSRLFPKEVVEYIYANCKGITRVEMTERLNAEFGAKYTHQQIQTYYSRNRIVSGTTGKCANRHRPPKGVYPKGLYKWHIENNRSGKPKYSVGDVVKREDGYLHRKVGDGELVKEHHYVWEQANGPVPKGYMLIFKDGDRTNCELENLALVSRAENVYLTRKKMRFTDPQLTESAVNLAKLHIAAMQKKGETK